MDLGELHIAPVVNVNRNLRGPMGPEVLQKQPECKLLSRGS